MKVSGQLLYKIGEIALACGVTRRAILHYESKGLLAPACVNEASGYRYYTSRDFSILTQIIRLKESGLSLKEIGAYMRSESSMEEQIARLQSQKSQLEQSIAQLRSRGIQYGDYNVELLYLPERTCFVRSFFCRDVEEAIHAAVSTVDEAIRLGLQFSAQWDCFCEYPVEGTFSGDITLEGFHMKACIPLNMKTLPEGCITYPSCNAVFTYHRGAYEDIASAYHALKRFIDTSMIRSCGAAQEIYVEGPSEHGEKADRYLTQIMLPVEDEL